MFIFFSAVFGSFIILFRDCLDKSSIQQEEGSFYQKIGIKFKEGTS